MDWRQVRAAVVGSGPSGFYVAGMLVNNGARVDMYERLPVPYGLVRHGVAPDHLKIKSVTRVFDKTAAHPRFFFHGGIEIGLDVSHEELRASHHLTVYATGLSRGADLGVPGEELAGSMAASDLVSWYNGHPDFRDRVPDLSAATAVVVGNGNVALDVARILVLSPTELHRSDAPAQVVEALSGSRISRVLVVGRRGPAEASFTTKELADLADLEGARVTFEDPAVLDGLDGSGNSRVSGNLEVFRTLAQDEGRPSPREIHFVFGATVQEILGDNHVAGVRISRSDGRDDLVVDAGMVVRAIGYQLADAEQLPRDASGRRISHDAGRLLDADGVRTGDYVVGWAKRGASGVIGTNKQCATDTFRAIEADVKNNRVRQIAHGTAAVGTVDWPGWQRIDEIEIAAGVEQGRPRVKLTSAEEIAAALSAWRRGALPETPEQAPQGTGDLRHG